MSDIRYQCLIEKSFDHACSRIKKLEENLKSSNDVICELKTQLLCVNDDVVKMKEENVFLKKTCVRDNKLLREFIYENEFAYVIGVIGITEYYEVSGVLLGEFICEYSNSNMNIVHDANEIRHLVKSIDDMLLLNSHFPDTFKITLSC